MQKQVTTHKINSIKKNKSLFIVKIIKEVWLSVKIVTAVVAQSVEHWSYEPEVAGSIPANRRLFFYITFKRNYVYNYSSFPNIFFLFYSQLSIHFKCSTPFLIDQSFWKILSLFTYKMVIFKFLINYCHVFYLNHPSSIILSFFDFRDISYIIIIKSKINFRLFRFAY